MLLQYPPIGIHHGKAVRAVFERGPCKLKVPPAPDRTFRIIIPVPLTVVFDFFIFEQGQLKAGLVGQFEHAEAYLTQREHPYREKNILPLLRLLEK